MGSANHRSLLVAFNHIGDLTLSTPLLRAVARCTRLSLLTRPFGEPLLAEQPYVERVWTLDYPNRGPSRPGRLVLGGHRRALGRRLAAAGFDAVLIYETERDVIRDWLQELFPGRVREIPHRSPQQMHAAERYRLGAAGLGCDMNGFDRWPVLEVGDRARNRARARLAPLGGHLVGIQMGSQRTHARRLSHRRANLKSLSTAQWRALIADLIEHDHADAVVLHGAASERTLVRRCLEGLSEDVRCRCHDLTGVGLDELPAVLAGHAALISVDTGTAHIAAAVCCPLLVLFGPTDPALFGPRGAAPIEVLLGDAPCQFCHQTTLYKTCRDNICLNRLEHGTLWGAWMRLQAKIEHDPTPISRTRGAAH